MKSNRCIITTITGLLALFLSGNACAQAKENDNPYKGLPFKERIFFGGDFALSFGDFTYIRLNPLLGYNVSQHFQIGAGPSYQYLRYRYRFMNQTFTQENHIYGGSTFQRVFLFENFFAQSTIEVLNLRSIFPKEGPMGEAIFERVTIPVWFVGGGYVQRTGGRGGFMFGAFYDLIQDRNSPYGRGLFISVGGFF